MCRHTGQVDILHLQFEVSVNPVVREHAATGQELAVIVQGFQGLFQAGAHGWDLCVFLWWQVVQVLSRWVARMDFVLDAVQTSHQQSREAQVWVGHWVWETRFNAAAFWIGDEWNAN